MTVRRIRRVAILLLALYAFGQVNVAFGACGMDRSSMAQGMAMPQGDGCDDSTTQTASVTAACVGHCTADVPLPTTKPAVAPPLRHALLTIPQPLFKQPAVGANPPSAVPRRILLHSFQV